MGQIYTSNENLIKAWPGQWEGQVGDILINPAEDMPSQEMMPLSADEARTIIKKLDSMDPGWGPQVTLMLTEAAYAVIAAVQMVKANTKNKFRGIFAQGPNLDMRFLRPKDIGGTVLNPAATANLGLYGGTSGGVYSWYDTGLLANATNHIIPEQTMGLYGAIVYCGFINRITVPPEDAYQWTLYGVKTPAQSAGFDVIKTLDDFELPVCKLERPILVPPLGVQQLDTYSREAGNTKFEPVAILVARSQDLTL